AARGARGVLRGARGARAEEEALDLRAARLAEAAARRGHPARGAALQGPQEHHPAAARRAVEERAGRASLRTADFHVAPAFLGAEAPAFQSIAPEACSDDSSGT